MKLLTFVAGPCDRLGALQGERIVDLNRAQVAMLAAAGDALPERAAAARLPADMETFLLGGSAAIARAKEALAWVAERQAGNASPVGPRGERIVYAREEVALKPPLRRPEKIIGIGLNYRDHCRETGRDIPTALRTFAMFANALIGPGDRIILPKTSRQIDWEAELVAVIGSPAKHVPAERALDYVAGYTIGNDVSARDHQQADPQTTRGKSADTHAPIGPWIVTTDEIPIPETLNIELTVNGVVKQSSNTSELVFPVAQIIAFLSRYFTLAPGDLIFTGTPAGVGFTRKPPEWLRAGDRVDITIERIGTLTNTCVAEDDGGTAGR